MTLANEWRTQYEKNNPKDFNSLKALIYDDIKREIQTDGMYKSYFTYTTYTYSAFTISDILRAFKEVAESNNLIFTKKKIPIDIRSDGKQHFEITISIHT